MGQVHTLLFLEMIKVVKNQHIKSEESDCGKVWRRVCYNEVWGDLEVFMKNIFSILWNECTSKRIWMGWLLWYDFHSGTSVYLARIIKSVIFVID